MHISKMNQFPWFDASRAAINASGAERLLDALIIEYREDMTTDEIILDLICAYNIQRFYLFSKTSKEYEALTWEIIGSRLSKLGLYRFAIRAYIQAIRAHHYVCTTENVNDIEYSIACTCIGIIDIFIKKQIYPRLTQSLGQWAYQKVEAFEGWEEE